MSARHAPWLGLLCLVGAQVCAQGMQVPGCGSLVNAYGPYDYTNPEDVRDHLPIVEQFHFDRGVETLKGHAQSGINNLGGDLGYTLRAFPNHHRALDTLGRYQLQVKQSPAPGARYSVECYFERAMAFAPTDGVVRMVYAIYLTRKGDLDGALQRYQEALELMPDSAELHYNLALLYLRLGRKEEALTHAQQAYATGFPLLGLKHKLIEAGVWREPPPKPAPAPTAPAPDAGSPTPGDTTDAADAGGATTPAATPDGADTPATPEEP